MTTSFLSNAASNKHVQLATTAIVSGAVVAGAILSYQRSHKKERIHRLKELKDSIPSLGDGGNVLPKLNGTSSSSNHHLPKPDPDDLRTEELARRAILGRHDDELILEQLARNRVFLTPEGLDKLRSSFVIVVGCGGVGSHATAALARSGVSKMRLVDFDQVSLSSLNRHAVATLHDVGTSKVECLQKRLLQIAPWVQFDLRQAKYWSDAADELLEPWRGLGAQVQKPDFIIDAIDNIETKVSLLKYCYDHKLPVISSMGAGCKSDPTRILVGDIGTGTDDRLSRATRRRLKLLGITSGIPIVYSTEKTGEGKAELMPLPEDEFKKGQVGDLSVQPQFRVRILPVLGTMPAVFGYTVANHVILSITGYPHDYLPAKGREKLYDGVLGAVQGYEEKMARFMNGNDPNMAIGLKTPINIRDIAFLVEEVYKGRSVVTGLFNRLVLIRWRKPTSSTLLRIGEGADEQKSSNVKISDLVCMTKEEATRHEKMILRGDAKLEDVYDAATIDKVEACLKEAASYEQYR